MRRPSSISYNSQAKPKPNPTQHIKSSVPTPSSPFRIWARTPNPNPHKTLLCDHANLNTSAAAVAHTAPAVPDTPPAAPEDTHTPAGAADCTHHTAAAAAGSDTVAARGGHIAAAAGGNLAVAGGSLAAARSSGVVRSLAAAGRKVEPSCKLGYFAGRRLGWRRGGTRLVRRRRRRWRRGAF